MGLLQLSAPPIHAQGGGFGGQEGDTPAFAGGEAVRGTVTAVAPDRLSVKAESGQAYQVQVTNNTRVVKDGQPAKFTEIKPGDGVGAMGTLDTSVTAAPSTTPKILHAVVVFTINAEQARKLREGLGKVFITGRLTAMDETKLTVMRPDGVSQVIEVDEGTSFKRANRGMTMMMGGTGSVDGGAGRPGSQGVPNRNGSDPGATGESITLADIKLGENIAGPGALKNGTFIPTQLVVSQPGSRRRRQAREADAATGNSGSSTIPGASGTGPK